MAVTPSGTVVAVSRSDHHSFSKPVQSSIQVRTGLGVEHDAHQGAKVKHALMEIFGAR